MGGIKNAAGKPVLLKMIAAIQRNKDYLGEVDGLIGDGDHGMNMNKGFTLFGERIAHAGVSFSGGLEELGNLLFSQIGGSMGPIYGTIFMNMAGAGSGFEVIGLAEFTVMVEAGLEGLYGIVEAKPGDKTLVDTLSPALDALKAAAGKNFSAALEDMKTAAAAGRDSTKDMIAKFGRSSRLGERSRGVLDAGAVSCCIILTAMADGLIERMEDRRGTIIIGCDNAAVSMKNMLIKFLNARGLVVEDLGCDSAGDPANYPAVARRVCEAIIASGYQKRGILLCGTGIGMCMTANKFKGIRAAVCHDNFSAERSVLSNKGNVLCMGERVIGHELAKKIVTEWISLEFRDGPSTPKVQEIVAIEAATMK